MAFRLQDLFLEKVFKGIAASLVLCLAELTWQDGNA
jgi:hypothetical protein